MRINFVIPPQQRTRFSGGVLCLLNYAQGLASRGHEVTVLTTHVSARPEWFAQPWDFRFLSPSILDMSGRAVQALVRAGSDFVRTLASGRPSINTSFKRHLGESINGASAVLAQRGGFGTSLGAAVDNLARCLPPADVTIATSFETAYPVALVGRGQGVYFAQHYEPLFWRECVGGELARKQAELSYRLGLRAVANSQWLSDQLETNAGLLDVPVCVNAIDHSQFSGAPTPRRDAGVLRIISYGGRNAEWKGFREMCEGMRLARQRNPAVRFEWSVYGSALLPPDNNIAPYRFLGFLEQQQLAQAYRANDVLLSASWYESFPLFPLEAMASGIAVICTQPGTESYAVQGSTAEIVRPQSVEDIADALDRLANDEPHRIALAERGQQMSLNFTWDRSVHRLEELLLSAASA